MAAKNATSRPRFLRKAKRHLIEKLGATARAPRKPKVTHLKLIGQCTEMGLKSCSVLLFTSATFQVYSKSRRTRSNDL